MITCIYILFKFYTAAQQVKTVDKFTSHTVQYNDANTRFVRFKWYINERGKMCCQYCRIPLPLLRHGVKVSQKVAHFGTDITVISYL